MRLWGQAVLLAIGPHVLLPKATPCAASTLLPFICAGLLGRVAPPARIHGC